MQIVIDIPKRVYNYIRKYEHIANSDVSDIKDAIINGTQPKKGYWVKHDILNNTYYDCSLCGCVAPCTEFADSFVWKLSNFCPDCGAYMRGVKEE